MSHSHFCPDWHSFPLGLALSALLTKPKERKQREDHKKHFIMSTVSEDVEMEAPSASPSGVPSLVPRPIQIRACVDVVLQLVGVGNNINYQSSSSIIGTARDRVQSLVGVLDPAALASWTAFVFMALTLSLSLPRPLSPHTTRYSSFNTFIYILRTHSSWNPSTHSLSQLSSKWDESANTLVSLLGTRPSQWIIHPQTETGYDSTVNELQSLRSEKELVQWTSGRCFQLLNVGDIPGPVKEKVMELLEGLVRDHLGAHFFNNLSLENSINVVYEAEGKGNRSSEEHGNGKGRATEELYRDGLSSSEPPKKRRRKVLTRAEALPLARKHLSDQSNNFIKVLRPEDLNT
ncbi:hypothetical protein T439DRAFT_347337, partial [Meredithblackwellia eburnea MCA 4105]